MSVCVAPLPDPRDAGATPDRKFPRAMALKLAEKIVESLRPATMKIEIAGSLRRGKSEVGDIEIVYIPALVSVPNPNSLFREMTPVNAVDILLAELIERGSLAKRPNKNGHFTWGEENKLAVAVKTGIPVDLFAASQLTWFNYLVCRTGGQETNVTICAAALNIGWRWKPYDRGFVKLDAAGNETQEWRQVRGERDVFEFVGLPYLKPEERP